MPGTQVVVGAHGTLCALLLALLLETGWSIVPRPLHTGIGIPKSDLEPGMVRESGWEVPEGAKGWDKISAMAESSWNRQNRVWGDLEAQFADKRLLELGFDTHMNGSIVAPDIPVDWGTRERVVMPKKQHDLLWSVYLDILKVEGSFDGIKNGTKEYDAEMQEAKETFESMFGQKDFSLLPAEAFEEGFEVCVLCFFEFFWSCDMCVSFCVCR
jgi:hypothetical protein